jgi:hypothetical protein
MHPFGFCREAGAMTVSSGTALLSQVRPRFLALAGA